MIGHTNASTPTDTLPIEYVSPPIDWGAYMSYIPEFTPENVFITGIFLLIIPIIWDEYKCNKKACEDENLQ